MAKSVTFKPLASGRFRCNIKGCGAVVKQRRLNAHRRTHKEHPTPAAVSQPALKTVKLWYGRAICPHCDWANYSVEPGTVTCINCRGKFIVVRQ